MNEKQAKTFKRVIKKLNAMRSTLTKPERAILDALIVREPEVRGHAMSVQAQTAEAQQAGAAAAGAAQAGALREEAASAEAVTAEAVQEVVITIVATGYVAEL